MAEGEEGQPEAKVDDGQDPRLKKLAELGADMSLLEGDPDPALIEVLLASA
jgi:hypothetical protein